MDDTPITRREHMEFSKRIDEENTRQNRRISLFEGEFHKLNALTVAVEKMAVSMEIMLNEQRKQGERLEKLEDRDGEMWRKVTGYIITSVISIIIGFIFSKFGMQ